MNCVDFFSFPIQGQGCQNCGCTYGQCSPWEVTRDDHFILDFNRGNQNCYFYLSGESYLIVVHPHENSVLSYLKLFTFPIFFSDWCTIQQLVPRKTLYSFTRYSVLVIFTH